MKLNIFVSFVVVLLASFSSCAASTTKTIVVEVSCSEIQENKHITNDLVASIGDTITIELCAYLTTDYQWKYKTIGNIGKSWEPIVRGKDYEFVEQGGVNDGLEGSNEKRIWTFEVVGKGTTEIRMEYTRQQTGVETVDRTYSMIVAVK